MMRDDTGQDRKKESDTLHWYEVRNRPGKKQLPQWCRSAAVSADWTVFLLAALAGNETAVLLCAAFDGIPIIIDRQRAHHCYVPSWWLVREYPGLSSLCIHVSSAIGKSDTLSGQGVPDPVE